MGGKNKHHRPKKSAKIHKVHSHMNYLLHASRLAVSNLSNIGTLYDDIDTTDPRLALSRFYAKSAKKISQKSQQRM